MNALVYVRAFIGVKNKVHTSTKEKWNFSSSTNYEILRSVSIQSKSLVKISSGDEHTEDDYYDLIPNPYRRSVYFSPIPYFTARSGGGGEWWNSFKRAPGSEFLGKRAPGSEFLGKRAPGSEFLGKRAPGSEFLGKRAPGSEFLGKRAPGSEVSLDTYNEFFKSLLRYTLFLYFRKLFSVSYVARLKTFLRLYYY